MPPGQTDSSPAPGDVPADPRRPEVLLTEDNPGDARLVKELLGEAPSSRWDVTWLRSKEAALERLAGGAVPDVMLLDLGLPDSRGLDTLRAVLSATARVPVVVLTGHADSELGAEAVREGAQDYLRKEEVTSRGLVRTLDYAIERKKTQDELLRAKEKFERVFGISPVGLAMFDSEEVGPAQVNDAFLEQFGYDRDELVGGQVRTRDLWAVQDEWQWVSGQVLEGETVRNVEVRFTRADDTEFDGLLSVAPLEVEDHRYWVAAIKDISPLKEDERRLQHRALHDGLTNLPNRSLFDDRLDHALDLTLRTGKVLAVLFVDLDRFKQINDTRGHEAGDRVLKAAAQRLQATVREPDTVARIGGDEFAVLLEGASGREEVTQVAGRIATAFMEPIELGDGTISVDVSIGGAVHDGTGDARTSSPSEIVNRADAAMYRAKETQGPSLVIAGGG